MARSEPRTTDRISVPCYDVGEYLSVFAKGGEVLAACGAAAVIDVDKLTLIGQIKAGKQPQV
jgi:hypothetical protein